MADAVCGWLLGGYRVRVGVCQDKPKESRRSGSTMEKRWSPTAPLDAITHTTQHREVGALILSLLPLLSLTTTKVDPFQPHSSAAVTPLEKLFFFFFFSSSIISAQLQNSLAGSCPPTLFAFIHCPQQSIMLAHFELSQDIFPSATVAMLLLCIDIFMHTACVSGTTANLWGPSGLLIVCDYCGYDLNSKNEMISTTAETHRYESCYGLHCWVCVPL